MKKRSDEKGAVLVETLIVLPLVAMLAFPLHVRAIREGNVRLKQLQETRLRYDGERSWNP